MSLAIYLATHADKKRKSSFFSGWSVADEKLFVCQFLKFNEHWIDRDRCRSDYFNVLKCHEECYYKPGASERSGEEVVMDFCACSASSAHWLIPEMKEEALNSPFGSLVDCFDNNPDVQKPSTLTHGRLLDFG